MIGIGSVSFLSTIIAAPVVLDFEIASLACRVLGMAGRFVSRRLALKAKKQDEIKLLARIQMNTISDRVSTLWSMD
jgi:hypothetical protein